MNIKILFRSALCNTPRLISVYILHENDLNVNLNINLLLDPRILRHRQSHLDHFRDLTKMVGIYHHLLESSEIYEDDISASFSTRGASAERRKSR